MDLKLLTPILVAAFVAWALYRRVRRNVGRQLVTPKRMMFRIGVFSVIGAMVMLASMREAHLAAAMAAGLGAGALLAWFGLRYTRFEVTVQGSFYTPHTYIGLFVSALLLGRIAYRLLLIYPAMHAAAQTHADAFAQLQKSPLTLAIFGVLVGYYVAYYAGVLGKSRGLSARSTDTVH